MASNNKSKLSTKDYERLGRSMQSVFDAGYASKRRVFAINFLRGAAFGIGSAVGAALFLALLFWLLSFFTELPVIGDLAETIRTTIDNETNIEEFNQ